MAAARGGGGSSSAISAGGGATARRRRSIADPRARGVGPSDRTDARGNDAPLAHARPQHVMRPVARHLAQPRQEARRLAQLAQVAPGGEEHVLRDVVAGVDVTQDRERDRGHQPARLVDEPGEGIPIAARRGAHQVVQGHGSGHRQSGRHRLTAPSAARRPPDGPRAPPEERVHRPPQEIGSVPHHEVPGVLGEDDAMVRNGGNLAVRRRRADGHGFPRPWRTPPRRSAARAS